MKRLSHLTWWHYAVLVLVVLLLFSIWAVPMRGFVLPSATDTFLATLGSIMGAIFAAGGLLLAIAALITLVTVESKARDAAKEVLQEVRGEMDADLTSALAAYDHLLLARNSINRNNLADLRDAEHMVETALKKRPELPNASTWVAITLCDAAFRFFLINHFNDNQFRDMPVAAGNEIDFNANVHSAIRWMREIIEKIDDEDERVKWQAFLATAYGLAGNCDEMLRMISQIPEARREAEFNSRRYRLSVAAGLRAAMTRSSELHALLPRVFPPQMQTIRESWLTYREQGGSSPRLGLWVLQKSTMPNMASISLNPGVIWLMPFAETQVVLKWRKDRTEYVSYPSEPSEASDIDGALAMLDAHFIPICRVEGEVYP